MAIDRKIRSSRWERTGAKHSSLLQSCGSRLPSATILYLARFGLLCSSYLIVDMAMVGSMEEASNVFIFFFCDARPCMVFPYFIEAFVPFNIVEIFQSDKSRLYGDFQKITLQKDDLIINQDQGKFKCTGRFVESIIGLSGNKDEVNNEIFYRYENSYLPNKLEELGVVDGDTIMLGNLEFEYKK